MTTFRSSFLSTLGLLLALMLVFALPSAGILRGQLREILFSLNLESNREQAERLATLVSLDLEKGQASEHVLAKVQDMLESTPQSKEHFACIVEDENRVIAHPNPTNVGKDVTGWTLADGLEVKTFTQAAGEGIPFGGVQTRLDGSQDISFQVPISTKPWAVCVHTKLDLIDEQAGRLMRSISAVAVPALLALALLSAWILAMRTRRPRVEG